MPVEVRVPSLGESVVEATVLRWHKKEGDAVAVGDALAELETDKVNVDVPADQAGVLQQIVKGEGETANVGDVIAIVDETAAAGAPAAQDQPAAVQAQPSPQAGAPAQPAAQAAAETTRPTEAANQPPAAAAPPAVPAAPQPARAPAAAATQIAAPSSPAPSPVPLAAAPDGSEHLRATPVARRLAQEHGVDLASVAATGPGGRVRMDDVTSYLAGAQPASAAPPVAPRSVAPPPAASRPAVQAFSAVGEREERVPMTRRRRTIAQRLVEARSITAMLTTFNECDLSRIMDIRKRRRDAFRERHGVGLGFMSFFTRAAVGALKTYPRLNAEIRGDDLIVKHHYDIGVAVDTEEGLVVPVVRDADRLTFAQIEQTIADLAKRARDGKLSIADLQGGTFTITNGGVFGSLMSTPIINMPQAAILGMHRIQERPVVVDGQIVIRPMMYLALTYDHRIVDGREAVQFLAKIKELVEDPETLLIEG